jgi:hypothetical protein
MMTEVTVYIERRKSGGGGTKEGSEPGDILSPDSDIESLKSTDGETEARPRGRRSGRGEDTGVRTVIWGPEPQICSYCNC